MTVGAFLRLLRANQRFLAILLSVAIFFTNVAVGTTPDIINIIFLVVVFSKYLLTGYVKSFEFALAVSIIALFAVPAALSVFESQGEYVVFLAGAIIFSEALHFFSEALNRRSANPRELDRKFNFALWLFLVLVFVGGWHLRLELGSILNVVLFIAPYAASLVVLERSLATLSKQKIYAIITVYVVSIFYYIFFFWSGFGRLVISAYFLMPLLIVNNHRDIGLRVWHLVIVIPIALVGAFIMRFQESDFQRIMEDSWSSHLTLTREMVDTMSFREPAGFSAYIDQFALLFFQWVPRSIWPDKPLGVGLTFVDDWMGREGFDIGHSIAIGFMGETLWYLGSGFLIGIFLIFTTLVALRYLAATLDKGGYALLSIFDSFLPSFFWGGMATYGSRFWFFFLPAVMVIYIFRLRIHRKISY